MDLTYGVRGAFASDAERRAVWEAHRANFLARCQPWTRPQAFWDYDGPPELREPRDWRCVTPEPSVVEWMGWQRAAEIHAQSELTNARRHWLASVA